MNYIITGARRPPAALAAARRAGGERAANAGFPRRNLALVRDSGEVEAEYPEHLLAREPAPPYAGEAAFALWHFSEDPSLHRFEPHVPATSPRNPPLVWAVDTRHAPMFWFPRDCPRGCIWPVSTTTEEDRERFFGQSAARRVHVMEASWLDRVRDATLYAYRLPTEAFRPHESVGGYWVADQPVEATERDALTDHIGRHAAAGIELRITPSIWPFWRRVTRSTVEFSGSRLRNSDPRPESLGLPVIMNASDASPAGRRRCAAGTRARRATRPARPAPHASAGWTRGSLASSPLS